MTKYVHESIVFLRERTFSVTNGHESIVIFERIDVFLIKYGHASSEFFVKNRKKDHLIDFFGPYNRVVLAELIFSTKYGYDSRGSFI